MTKPEALKAMRTGKKVYHDYYSSDEYLYMTGGIIRDENDYKMGRVDDEFWKYIQHWTDGWHIRENTPV